MRNRFNADCPASKGALKSVVSLCALLAFILGGEYSVVHAAEIRSKAAVVMEASTGRILYGKNPSLKLLPASTAKLMTAMVVLDRISPQHVVTISERAVQCSPIKAHFKIGENVTIETLLHAALIKSANDAAYALAEAVTGSEESFVELMNQKGIALGMSDTMFVNATGLPGSGQYITGYDLAKMLRQALRYPLIKDIINVKTSRITTEDGRGIFIKNSNRLLWSDESVLGGKTGYTREAKHCFVCASEQGSETIIVALLGAPSRELLWKESEVLLDRGFAIVDGREEPVMHFTRSDYYRESIQPAAYAGKKSEYQESQSKKTSKGTMKTKNKRTTAKKGVAKKPTAANTIEAKKVSDSKG